MTFLLLSENHLRSNGTRILDLEERSLVITRCEECRDLQSVREKNVDVRGGLPSSGAVCGSYLLILTTLTF